VYDINVHPYNKIKITIIPVKFCKSGIKCYNYKLGNKQLCFI
jgi:hypothetical protein